MGLRLLLASKGRQLRSWLKIQSRDFTDSKLAERIAHMECWYGYYEKCESLASLLARCENRLATWRSFLNTNIDSIPDEIWTTKATVEGPLHALGNVLKSLRPASERLPLFVIIDQYEVLPELNPTFGSDLQRIVNTLIKLRDPVVFFKIGARTHDWGGELRIWGADSRIEVQRDYLMINLADLLMRDEDSNWLFPRFARDVAYKRVKVEGHYQRVSKTTIEKMFGSWSPEDEARLYFRDKARRYVAIGRLSERMKHEITRLCGRDPSPLDLRLAGAWVLQRQRRRISDTEIFEGLKGRPWRRQWWRKERTGVALLQVASRANQKRRYFGWTTILHLAGSNVLAFLLLCGEIWDLATKVSAYPLRGRALSPQVQAEGVYAASEKWSIRDRNENIGGRHRYDVLSRLGPAIHDALVGDLAISNPGHSGFSLRETNLVNTEEGRKAARFLQDAVSWGIFEERPHTSKEREAATRRKWYLHPLLSPFFAIPYVRVKEPYYASIEEVHDWLFTGKRVKFGRRQVSSGTEPFLEEDGSRRNQLPLPFDLA